MNYLSLFVWWKNFNEEKHSKYILLVFLTHLHNLWGYVPCCSSLIYIFILLFGLVVRGVQWVVPGWHNPILIGSLQANVSGQYNPLKNCVRSGQVEPAHARKICSLARPISPRDNHVVAHASLTLLKILI